MSNCVTVRSAVAFYPDTLDTVQLRADIDRVNALPQCPAWQRDSFDVIIWWFVCGAVTIKEDGSVLWTPGMHCRSGHTWRDFQGTLDYFASIALRPFDAMVSMRDDDAPTEFGWQRIGWRIE